MFYYVKAQDIQREYDTGGFAYSELLPGTYDGGIKNYQCFLKSGCQVSPPVYGDKTVLFFFGKGRGYITDTRDAYKIQELCFYAPFFDKVPYAIHAAEDMEFVMSVVDMSPSDFEVFNHLHARLPFFRTLGKCVKYDQSCKGPNTTSWFVLTGQQLGRIMVGVVQAVGEGTVEKGHPAVHQWNYCVGDSDFNLTVEGETVKHKSGDWSFIPAGYDHSLVADPGKEVFYIWFEHFAREKDFIIKPYPDR